MRSIFTAILVFICGNQAFMQSSKEIKWYSMDEALKVQQTAPKKLLIDVYTNWCGPCKMMMANTFTNERVIELVNQHFYPVKFNAEGPDSIVFRGTTFKNANFNPGVFGRNSTHDFTMAIAPVNGQIAYPTIVYLDEQLNMIQPVQGYLTPPQIEPILLYFGSDAYKTTPYDEWMKTFQSKL